MLSILELQDTRRTQTSHKHIPVCRCKVVEKLTLPEHLSSPRVFNGVHVTRSLVLCTCFVDRCLSIYIFLFAIVLSVLLRRIMITLVISSNSSSKNSTKDTDIHNRGVQIKHRRMRLKHAEHSRITRHQENKLIWRCKVVAKVVCFPPSIQMFT
jgi:hypothetical protein